MGILTWVIWGLFVGAVARLLLPGRQRIGIVRTILLGVAGSLLGGFLATEVLHVGDANDADLGSFVIAVGTSLLLLAVYELVTSRLHDRERRDGGRRGRRGREHSRR